MPRLTAALRARWISQEIVYQAHSYGWWLRHSDKALGSLSGKQATPPAPARQVLYSSPRFL
jgi:hypothetical protein